ncbi:hypothetical protein ABPG72_022473 [Tetrahymena utriculariae]
MNPDSYQQFPYFFDYQDNCQRKENLEKQTCDLCLQDDNTNIQIGDLIPQEEITQEKYQKQHEKINLIEQLSSEQVYLNASKGKLNTNKNNNTNNYYQKQQKNYPYQQNFIQQKQENQQQQLQQQQQQQHPNQNNNYQYIFQYKDNNKLINEEEKQNICGQDQYRLYQLIEQKKKQQYNNQKQVIKLDNHYELSSDEFLNNSQNDNNDFENNFSNQQQWQEQTNKKDNQQNYEKYLTYQTKNEIQNQDINSLNFEQKEHDNIRKNSYLDQSQKQQQQFIPHNYGAISEQFKNQIQIEDKQNNQANHLTNNQEEQQNESNQAKIIKGKSKTKRQKIKNQNLQQQQIISVNSKARIENYLREKQILIQSPEEYNSLDLEHKKRLRNINNSYYKQKQQNQNGQINCFCGSSFSGKSGIFYHINQNHKFAPYSWLWQVEYSFL